MTTVLLTGARGFIGKNLSSRLAANPDINLLEFNSDNTTSELSSLLVSADVIFHLAGVNRCNEDFEYEEGNAELTQVLVDAIQDSGREPHVIMSSSIQALLDNPYGSSKRHSEEILLKFAQDTGTRVSIFRLKNVFGKWCRPDYNSVTATFCHNIANDLPISISDPDRAIDLVCVDDVVDAFIVRMNSEREQSGAFVEPDPIASYGLTLGDLADRIRGFRRMRETLEVPDFSIRFNQQLYATYLSYVPKDRWEYGPDIRSDERGNLAELIKSPFFGQVFVSRTKPGVTRGNHYHHTKTEKFMVVAGEGVIRFRQINQPEIEEISVRGKDYRIIDIPPGYTHSITNSGKTEMITLFWASEQFNPGQPDTYYVPVDPA